MLHPSAPPLQVAIVMVVFLALVTVVLLLAGDAHRRGRARVAAHNERELDRILTGIRLAAGIPDADLDAMCVVRIPRSRPSASSVWGE